MAKAPHNIVKVADLGLSWLKVGNGLEVGLRVSHWGDIP